MYNHVAIWPIPTLEDDRSVPGEYCRWPTGIRNNEHLLLNSDKMSKSTGNIMTIRQSIERFSADGTRFALADDGDGLEDANFVFAVADASLLRLHAQLEWVKDVLAKKNSMRNEERNKWTQYDVVFYSEINKAIILTDQHYKNALFREAIKTGFFDLQAARDRYRDLCLKETNMNWQLLERFIEVQTLLLCPVCPHITEHIWNLIGKTESIMQARWPQAEQVDEVVLKESQYISETLHDFRVRIKKMMELRDKNGLSFQKPEYGVVYVANGYPSWQLKILEKLKDLYKTMNCLPENNVILQSLKSEQELLPVWKKVMPFVQSVKANFTSPDSDFKLSFDEKLVLERNLIYLTQSLELKELWVEDVSNAKETKLVEECTPGNPISVFTNTAYKPFQVVTTVCESTSFDMPIYDGDVPLKISKRIKRFAEIDSNVTITLWYYREDGKTKLVPSSASFCIQNEILMFQTPECEVAQDVGNRVQYSITY